MANSNVVKSTRYNSEGRMDAPQWVMNDLGTRLACVAWEAGREEINPETKAFFTPYDYFVDIHDAADGRRLCHHKYSGSADRRSSGTVMGWSPGAIVMVFSPDGARLALQWSVRRTFWDDKEKANRTETDQLFRVLDVASGKVLYELTLTDFERRLGPSSRGFSTAFRPVFFPDGNRVALLSGGRDIRLGQSTPTKASLAVIDLQAQPARELFRNEVSNMVFSPFNAVGFVISPDGPRMAHLKMVEVRNPETGDSTREYSLSLISAATGKETASIKIESMPTNIIAMAFSPDSRKLFFSQNARPTAFAGGRITKSTEMIFDAESGKELCKEVNELGFTASGGPLNGCRFSPDGTRIYLYNGSSTGTPGGHTFAFAAATCKPLAGFESDIVMRQNVMPDDRTIFIVDGNAVAVRNASTGKLLRTLRGHVEPIAYLGMAPNGKTISTLDITGEYKVWNTEPVQPVTLTGLTNNTTRSSQARLSPDGRYVVGFNPEPNAGPSTLQESLNRAAEAPTRMSLWETTSGRMQNLPLRPIPEEFKQFRSNNNMIFFSPNSRFVAARRSLGFPGGEGFGVAANGKTVDRGRLYSDLTVWDTSTGQEAAHLVLPDTGTSFLNNVNTHLTPDGKHAVISDLRSTLQVLELATGRVMWSLNNRPGSGERSEDTGTFGREGLTMSPDGRYTVVLGRILEPSSDGGIRASSTSARCTVLETVSGKVVRSFDLPYEAGLAPTWSADGKRLALTGTTTFNRNNTLLRVFDFETGKKVMSIDGSAGNNVILQNVVFSPDGRRIAAVQTPITLNAANGKLNGIKVWDAATGQEMLWLPWGNEPGPGFVSRIFSSQIAFTSDGNKLAQFTPRGTLNASAMTRFFDATPVKRQ